MPNEEQLARLAQGVLEWNYWRKLNPTEVIDLHGATLDRLELAGANLSGAQLSYSNLGFSDLNHADLSHSKLHGADLYSAFIIGADLSGAELISAGLTRANLSFSNLRGADLRGADLLAANLGNADPTGANLENATFGATVIGNTDLTGAIGLGQCNHRFQSMLDHRTLEISRQLPTTFLRGCGLSDNYIAYLPSHLNQPSRFYSCFISCSSKDQEFADRLYADLQDAGVRCWFARHDLAAGRKIHEQIDQAIHAHDRLLLILSDHSMKSRWVKTEIANARKKELAQNRQVLFPIRLIDMEAIRLWKLFDADAGDDSAAELREYFIPDFTNWGTDHAAYKRTFDKLVRDLQAKEGQSAKA